MSAGGKLKDKEVAGLVKPGKYLDGAGLMLHVRNENNRSWVFRYKVRGSDGVTRYCGLGPYPDISLDKARTGAKAMRNQLREGIDPIQARERERDANRKRDAEEAARRKTFRDVAALCIADQKSGWKNDKHAAQWAATLEAYAYPEIGDMRVADIETRHVLAVIKPIWNEKNETASRVRGRIERVLSYATTHEWRTGENPARWTGHLDNILPKPSKVKTVEHFAALPWREIGGFMETLAGAGGVGALALRFAILCAARSGEVRGATWGEIDLDRAVWTIPAPRMKAGKEHSVPLTEPAMAILQEMAQAGTDADALVFPGAKEGKPLSDMSLTAVLRRMGRGELTAHGFRSTFRDWAADTGKPEDIAEASLAHAKGKVEGAYQRSEMMDRRRKLMDEWVAFCGTKPGEVIQLRKVEAA